MSPQCASCGSPLPDDAAFCEHCGAPAAQPAETPAACPQCGVPVEAEAAFCEACGAALAPAAEPGPMTCPSCGAENPPASAFCESCGAPLSTEEERKKRGGLLGTAAKAAGAGAASGSAAIGAAAALGQGGGAAAASSAAPPAAGTANGASVIGSVIKVTVILISTLVGVVIAVVVLAGFLVFTGTPRPCSDRPIPVSPAASAALRQQPATAGRATVTLTESEVTSRGVQYLAEKDVPLRDLQVHFCSAGYADSTGTVSALGRNVHVLARGTLDLTGQKPGIDVISFRAGNLPGPITRTILDRLLHGTRAGTLDMREHPVSITFAEGQVTLAGHR